MISYLTVGADDFDAAERFYGSFLPALGYTHSREPGGLSFSIPAENDQTSASVDLYVLHPFDGQPTSPGNGTMVAFQARDQAQVRNLHAAALAAGGTDEGEPGFRAIYSANFYVGYLRDPHGNKIALFSTNPADPDRDGKIAASA
ncbi:MAG: VOC family protein [Pseudomonadota bacterium]